MTRTLALFMGVWMSLVQSDAGLFHACSAGNATIAALALADAVAPEMVSTSAHDHHAAVAPNASTRPTEDWAHESSVPEPAHQHQSGDNECHCIGHCSVASTPALRAGDDFTLVAELRITTSQPGRASHAVVVEWAEYVLPFATAPPAVIAG